MPEIKTKTAVIVGATGLVGQELVKLLLASDMYSKITILTRRSLELDATKIEEYIIDFENIEKINWYAEDAFCCLGTTRKQAGSKQAFYQVDYIYVDRFAHRAYQNGAKQFLMISSMGANKNSFFYYSRVKGKIEESIQNLGFDQGVKIFRPSLLLGERSRKRFGEEISKLIFKIISPILPMKYRAVHARNVAQKMLQVALHTEHESKIYESNEIQSEDSCVEPKKVDKPMRFINL